jgi:hypothetical protein
MKAVMEKMADYGDRVQFSMSSGPEPSYQLTNSQEKKMAFDRNHHLLRPQEEDFAPGNVSPVFSLDQVKSLAAGVRTRSSAGTRAPRAAKVAGTATRTTAAKLDEQFATERYEYFKTHRQMLPQGLSGHSDEIVALMKNGKSVEDAFNEVIEKYF